MPFKYSPFFRFVGGNQASLDGVNAYRLEAYVTLLFGASSDCSRSREIGRLSSRTQEVSFCEEHPRPDEDEPGNKDQVGDLNRAHTDP